MLELIFFLTSDNELYFNEINNLPGLSPTGIFIKMWLYKYTYVDLLHKILNIDT